MVAGRPGPSRPGGAPSSTGSPTAVSRAAPGIRDCPGWCCWLATVAAGPRCAGSSRPPTSQVRGACRSAASTSSPSTPVRSPRTGRSRSCSAQPPSSAGRSMPAVTTSPASTCPAGATRSAVTRSSSRWSATADRATSVGRPGCSASPGQSMPARSSPTSCATPTGPTPRPLTSWTPPAGWWRWTCATSTGATPRPRCCPARRWPRSPSRSPAPPAWLTTAALCWPAPGTRPSGARSTRAATWVSARCTSPSWSPAADRGRRCCARAARPASAGGRWPRAPAPWPGLRTSSASSRDWATPRTSSPSPTSSTSSAAWGCGWRRGGAAPAAWSPTCSASPTSTRSATACSWSGSFPRCAGSCPTSTSTSSPPGAPRSTSRS